MKKLLGMAIALTAMANQVTAQTNLFRNPGFENHNPHRVTGIPNAAGQLDRYCRHWDQIGVTTSDWFRSGSTTGHLRGSQYCGGNGEGTWMSGVEVVAHGGDHYAGIQTWVQPYWGEGVQQKIQSKLQGKRYKLSFYYYIPCDSNIYNYNFEVFMGRHRDNDLLLVIQDSIPRTNSLVWTLYEHEFTIPKALENELDWLMLVNEGTHPSYSGAGDNNYFYLDDFSLTETDCGDCEPDGLISYN